MSLFRREVLDSQSAQWLGSVCLNRPIGFSVMTGLALVLASLLISFATWGEVGRTTKVTGLLVPSEGSLSIMASQDGVIVDRRVVEGQAVSAKEVILVIDVERQGIAGGAGATIGQHIHRRQESLRTERALRELNHRQRLQTLEERLRVLNAQIAKADEELQLQRNRMQIAETALQRFQQLAKEGFVAPVGVQSKQDEVLEANSKVHGMERAQLGLRQEKVALDGDRSAMLAQLRLELARLDRDESNASQEATENSIRTTVVVAAPRAGILTAINLQPGQSVKAGQTLGTLVPTATGARGLEAHLYAPSRTVGFVKAGQRVYLRYAAYPYQKFGLQGGRVTAVSATPFAPSELPPNIAQQLLAQAGSNEALYRVNVELDEQAISLYGEKRQLKSGLTLEADVVQEHRKVWEWVLEPVLAAQARIRILGGHSERSRTGRMSRSADQMRNESSAN